MKSLTTVAGIVVRITQGGVALSLLLTALGTMPVATTYPALGAIWLAIDALTARSLCGQVVDGAAVLGLVAISFGVLTGPVSIIVLVYASASIAADAFAPASLRARHHHAI